MSAEWTPDTAIEQAKDDSVTRKKLLGTKGSKIRRPFQKFGIFRGWVHKKPLFEYLTEHEIPHYLYAISNSVTKSVGDNTFTYEPHKPYRTLFALTDDRIIFLIGQKPENELLSVWYHDIESFTISPQTETINFPTADRTIKSQPNKPKIPTAKARFEFNTAAGQIGINPSIRFSLDQTLDDIGPFLETKTDIFNWNGRKAWERLQQKYNRRLKAYEQWQQQLEQLVEDAEGAITKSDIRTIWDSLTPDEQPHFIFSGYQHHISIRGSETDTIADTKQYNRLLLTDHRILINNFESWEITYESVTNFGINKENIKYEEGDSTRTQETYILKIETADRTHQLDIGQLPIKEASKLMSHLRMYSDEDTAV
jgi:hypothetical protein